MGAAPSAKDADYDTCDLCNKDLKPGEDMDAHVQHYHPSLSARSQELEAYRPQSTLKPESIASIGAVARVFALKSDGGPDAFDVVVRAMTQFREICRMPFPTATLFAFGSCVALGSHDGEGDVDLTLVDPQGWADGTWPPSDEGKVILKLTAELRRAGFDYHELEPVVRTRVPVVRRKHDEVPHEGRRRVGEIDARTVRVYANIPSERHQAFIDALGLAQHQVESSKWTSNFVTVRAWTTSDAVAVKVQLEHTTIPRSVKGDSRISVEWCSKTLRPEAFLVDFDLSCRAHGIRNSLLIRAYMDQGPLVRAGSVFLKKWSKRCGLNNSLKGFITSYAVQLLWIYYLIQHRHVQFVSTDSFPAAPDPEMKMRYTETIPKDLINDPEKVRRFDLELGGMIAHFFRFFGYEFGWDTTVVSIGEETVLRKERVGWTQGKEVMAQKFRDRIWYRACIEDPFEENLNLARHLSPRKMLHVISVFRCAVRLIDAGREAELLADRTSPESFRRAVQVGAEFLIGKEEVGVQELQAHIYAHDPDSASAAQLEFAATKLLDQLGLEVSEDKSSARYRKRDPIRVLEQDRLLYQTVKRRVAEAGPCGIPLTPEARKANLHRVLLLHDPILDRLFASQQDNDVFARHVAAGMKVLGHEMSVPVDSFRTRVRHRLEKHCVDAVVDAMLTETSSFSMQGSHVRLASGQAGPAARPPSYVPDRYANKAVFRDASTAQPSTQAGMPVPRSVTSVTPDDVKKNVMSEAVGNCTECRKTKTKVWTTTRPDMDPGAYCASCWAKFC
jgi:hypothetical protein